MTWRKARFGPFRYNSGYDRVAPTFPRLVGQRFPFPGGPRPREPDDLTALHKLFWVALRTCWSGWTKPLILVTPRTVVNWHRAGVSFVLDVGLQSQPGRRTEACQQRGPRLDFPYGCRESDLGEHRAFTANFSSWVSRLSERSVSRWIRRAPRNPDSVKRWLTFLRNHREAIAAMDFFTVPTLTFGVLYCFFVIGHDRRKILHFNVTRNPNALWVVPQLREAWAYKQPHRFLLFDRDAKFGAEVLSAVRDMGSEPTRTAFRSPWQNGVAERWVGSCRRDLLDHVIILNDPADVFLPALCIIRTGRIFRGSTNQHAIPNRRTSAKEKEILLMWCTTFWRGTAYNRAYFSGCLSNFCLQPEQQK